MGVGDKGAIGDAGDLGKERVAHRFGARADAGDRAP